MHLIHIRCDSSSNTPLLSVVPYELSVCVSVEAAHLQWYMYSYGVIHL